METNAGSTLLPVIKIINNTTKELTNVVLSKVLMTLQYKLAN